MAEIILKRGLGKDGNPNVNYVRQHPTNYIWRPDLEKLTHRLVNMPKYKGKIWINTYFWHPPFQAGVITRQYDTVSFDVWAFGGRGAPLSPALRRDVFSTIFNMPGEPYIYWVISGGGMWVRGEGWQPAPWGPPDSDPGHYEHVHVTYF